MSRDLVKAHLNLCAVLQNLEDLVKLDAEMADMTKAWDVSIQFALKNGPAAYLEFKNGVCKHGCGHHSKPTIKLYFLSPGQLNGMFDGTASPIPLKGFTRLGFLKNEFTQLTERLVHYLKPENGQLDDENQARIGTILTLHTALYAVKELALLDPWCKEVASHIPAGTLQVEVLPEGPYAHIVFDDGTISVGKGIVEKPMAKMIFKDLSVVSRQLSGELDPFLAVPEGDITIQGQLPLVDSVSVILERVEAYLT